MLRVIVESLQIPNKIDRVKEPDIMTGTEERSSEKIQSQDFLKVSVHFYII